MRSNAAVRVEKVEFVKWVSWCDRKRVPVVHENRRSKKGYSVLLNEAKCTEIEELNVGPQRRTARAHALLAKPVTWKNFFQTPAIDFSWVCLFHLSARPRVRRH
jgi:hypothetical protein